MDWLTIAERFGVPVAMAIWLLIESRSSRRALELREIRHQAEMARREAEAATRCATREADMTKRIRELEESRMRELRAANNQYLEAISAVANALREFAAQDTEFHRAVRHLYQFLRTSCAHAAPPAPGGDGSDTQHRPSIQIPELTTPASATAKRKSSAEIRALDSGGTQ